MKNCVDNEMTCLLLILNVFFAQLLDVLKRLWRYATFSKLFNTLLSIVASTALSLTILSCDSVLIMVTFEEQDLT